MARAFRLLTITANVTICKNIVQRLRSEAIRWQLLSHISTTIFSIVKHRAPRSQTSKAEPVISRISLIKVYMLFFIPSSQGLIDGLGLLGMNLCPCGQNRQFEEKRFLAELPEKTLCQRWSSSHLCICTRGSEFLQEDLRTSRSGPYYFLVETVNNIWRHRDNFL